MGDICRHINLVELLKTEGFEPKSTGGGRHNMICPLHNDSKPSFIVFPDQNWRCFGCGRSGDAIEFVRELHDLSFKKALEYLEIHYTKVKKIVRKPDMLETIAAEEREGVDVLLRYGKELIDTLMFRRIRKEVDRHRKE